jgi:hypothetical protein
MGFAGLAERIAGEMTARSRGLGGLTRARLASVVVAVVSVGLTASVSPVGAAAQPVVSNLKATPATVDSFGTTTVTASVSGAETCTLSISAAIQPVGLPITFPCEAGPVELTGPMPVDARGKKVISYPRVHKFLLTLTATGAGGLKADAQVKVKVTHEGIAVPVEVTGLSTASQVSAGGVNNCALLSNGHAQCWGDNFHGELGSGTTAGSGVPVEVTGISTATGVSTGEFNSCGVLSSGQVECWGFNEWGQLGNGTTTDSVVPVEVIGISTATQVSAGGEDTCAVLSNGHVECWGGNADGQLGDGTEQLTSEVPVEVTGISTATQIGVVGHDACAALSTGHVECWGGNRLGRLGHGIATGPEFCNDRNQEPCSRTPLEVTDLSTATEVGGGAQDSCALLSDGHAECWGGENKNGELGNGEWHDDLVSSSLGGEL